MATFPPSPLLAPPCMCVHASICSRLPGIGARPRRRGQLPWYCPALKVRLTYRQVLPRYGYGRTTDGADRRGQASSAEWPRSTFVMLLAHMYACASLARIFGKRHGTVMLPLSSLCGHREPDTACVGIASVGQAHAQTRPNSNNNPSPNASRHTEHGALHAYVLVCAHTYEWPPGARPLPRRTVA